MPKRHGRSRHRQPRWQDAYDAREQEVDAYELDIKGLKEAVAVMCRGVTMLGDYAQHQVDRTPHFAPPLNLNQLTQSSPEPPPPGRFISRLGEGEGRINVIQAPQTDVTYTMNKEKKGGHTD